MTFRVHLFAVGLGIFCAATAWAIGDACAQTPTARGITTLQPATGAARRDRLAPLFEAAARESKLDPLLLVAIAFRESSLKRSVESGKRKGALGELGLMQSHGVALQFRPSDCTSRLKGARCQVQTGARFLAFARRQCGGSWWRWVAAYGMKACPSEKLARRVVSVRVARRHYLKIGGAGWRE